MLRIAVPSVLQQSTVSIGMMIVQAVVNPFGTQALAGYAATMRVENVFSLIFVSIGNAVSPYISQNFGAKKIDRLKKGYHAALVLDLCFAVIAFAVIETLHTQISSLFLGKDAYGMIDPEGGNMEMIIKDKGQVGGPLNQFSTLGYKFSSAAKILYEDRMVRVESCGAYSAEDEAN